MGHRSLFMELQVSVHTRQAAGPGHLRCPACHGPLTAHQPDPEAPRCLLASCSCEGCGPWFSLLPSPDDRSKVFLVRLPGPREIVEAMGRQRLA